MSNALIQCRNLQKSYGNQNVLHSVDFEIEPGQLVGFLGPNGAGKTTTIRILLGLLNPSSGDSSIFGKSCQREGKAIRHDVGYLPGDVHFYPSMTGRRILKFMAAARRRDCDAEFNRLAEAFELQLDKTVRKYSTGMRQKLGLIQALMHKPKLLMLDEPTSALDPLIRQTVFEELKNVVADGRSVLFSSHSLSEVEELCDEVIILRSGKIVEHQKIENLKNKAIRRVNLLYASAAAVPSEFPEHLDVLTRQDNAIVGTWSGKAGELVAWLSGQDVQDLIIEKPDLNDLFMAFYEPKE